MCYVLGEVRLIDVLFVKNKNKKQGGGDFCVNMINLLVYIMFHNEPIKIKPEIYFIASTGQKARIRLLSFGNTTSGF